MIAKIHARDADKPYSTGKSMDVSTTYFTVAANAVGTGYNRCLEITANDSESYGSGARGGDFKTIERTLTLSLNERDIRTIVEQSIATGMFSAPGTTELLAAHAALSEALRRLGLLPNVATPAV